MCVSFLCGVGALGCGLCVLINICIVGKPGNTNGHLGVQPRDVVLAVQRPPPLLAVVAPPLLFLGFGFVGGVGGMVSTRRRSSLQIERVCGRRHRHRSIQHKQTSPPHPTSSTGGGVSRRRRTRPDSNASFPLLSVLVVVVVLLLPTKPPRRRRYLMILRSPASYSVTGTACVF